jgi:hypothetical protein
MKRQGPLESILAERSRVQEEYRRRDYEIPTDLYAPWQPAEIFMRAGRKRVAATMLHQAGVFPRQGDQCLEVGFGSQGWLGDLITWGIRENDLHGIELDSSRVRHAKEILPNADLRVGDATVLPWNENSFRLVILSTVFTSILDSSIRELLASEVTRVIAPGGALLWYDFAVDNPRNPNVRGVGRKELLRLFPSLVGRIKRVTLAPPIARLLVPKSFTLALLLECLPPVRTHLLAVLVKRL